MDYEGETIMCKDVDTGKRYFFHHWHEGDWKIYRRKIKTCRFNDSVWLGIGYVATCCRCGKKKTVIGSSRHVSASVMKNIKEHVYL